MSKLFKRYKVKSILNKFFIFIKFRFKKIPVIKSINKYKNIYKLGNKIYNNQIFFNSQEKNLREENPKYKLYDVINKILSLRTNTSYNLEMGLKNPENNFKFIHFYYKYSIDPWIEAEVNRADFIFTSHKFFSLIEA